jgi:hypothetical protein
MRQSSPNVMSSLRLLHMDPTKSKRNYRNRSHFMQTISSISAKINSNFKWLWCGLNSIPFFVGSPIDLFVGSCFHAMSLFLIRDILCSKLFQPSPPLTTEQTGQGISNPSPCSWWGGSGGWTMDPSLPPYPPLLPLYDPKAEPSSVDPGCGTAVIWFAPIRGLSPFSSWCSWKVLEVMGCKYVVDKMDIIITKMVNLMITWFSPLELNDRLLYSD